MGWPIINNWTSGKLSPLIIRPAWPATEQTDRYLCPVCFGFNIIKQWKRHNQWLCECNSWNQTDHACDFSTLIIYNCIMFTQLNALLAGWLLLILIETFNCIYFSTKKKKTRKIGGKYTRYCDKSYKNYIPSHMYVGKIIKSFQSSHFCGKAIKCITKTYYRMCGYPIHPTVTCRPSQPDKHSLLCWPAIYWPKATKTNKKKKNSLRNCKEMQHNETIFTFVSTQNSFQFASQYFAIFVIAISESTNRVAGKTSNLNLNFN